MDLKELNKLNDRLLPTARMPVFFMGHGSPMNAIEENEFVAGFREMGRQIHTLPRAIICISAHWETRGTHITAMPHPPTIHDFGGFPPELYAVQYPAPGDPALAMEAKELVRSTEIISDQKWGLDHGAWSVIKHLYPNANIPVIQLSLDRTQPPSYHYELARELVLLREKGVLIIGSGNLVHNLGLVDWQRLNESFAYDWAAAASEKMKRLILEEDFYSLINFHNQGKAFNMAIPTPEHYLPLLYILGLKEKGETATFYNDKPVAGSLTMTSLAYN